MRVPVGLVAIAADAPTGAPAPGGVPLRHFLLLALAVVTAPAVGAAQSASRRAEPARIGFVSVSLLLDSVPGRDVADRRLAAQVEEAEALVRQATDSLRAALESFAEAQPGLSPVQREAAVLHLRARELQLEDMVQQLHGAVSQRRDALRKPLLGRILRAMREVRQREGWTAIVELESLGELTVVDPSADLTLRVLAVMRQHAPTGELRP